MLKLEIYIPCTYLDELREALRFVGAGTSDAYDSVLSYSLVRGSWRALPGANPYKGDIGKLCESDEYKVEVMCNEADLAKTISVIKAIHPYETPIINIIQLVRL